MADAQSFPAPVGGWNARDALADMDPRDAVTLDNWFPQASYCEIRGGYANWATGTTGNVKTLAPYNGLTSNKLFAFTSSGVYDATAQGAVGASVLARTSGKHQWVNFGDGSNNYLIAVNGIDKPAYYNGATWTAVDSLSTPALSVVTSTNIVNVFVSKGRLFFVENNKLGFWYLPAGAAGGACTFFDLSSIARRGGYVMAGATWTVDGGTGPDDLVVFVTSEGEIIVYQGTNPGSATAWSLVGVFQGARPLGRRCLEKFGGDLTVLTESGLIPMSSALQAASIDYTNALSDKIRNAFITAARTYGTVFGWRTTLYPQRNALIVNVPNAEDGTHVQYVMNTITKAWCSFSGWNAEDMTVFSGDLYFCSGAAVVKAWSGLPDGTSNVVAYGKTAFSYFGREGLDKNFKLFRPVLAVNGVLSFLTDIDVNFRDTPINGSATYTPVLGASWDVGIWDVDVWGAGLEIVTNWTSPRSFPGKSAAGKVKISTQSVTVQWLASDWTFEYGNIA